MSERWSTYPRRCDKQLKNATDKGAKVLTGGGRLKTNCLR
ncbi:Undefined function [Listeria monocytogenes]|nr:Undefined function [Listeria monocytogenes]